MRPPVTTASTNTTTPTITAMRLVSPPPRALATALAPSLFAANCCRRRFFAVRSAPPTGGLSLLVVLLGGLGRATASQPPIRRKRCARPDDQPCRQRQEADVRRDLLRIRRLARLHLSSAAETAAVDRQAPRPRLRHRGDEPHQHHRR